MITKKSQKQSKVPEYKKESFVCSFCQVYSHQQWSYYCEYDFALCAHCHRRSIWLNKEMIYPKKVLIEEPNASLSGEIKKDYLEAMSVLDVSPKASTSLLMSCLQKLCKQLGETGDNLTQSINNIANKGFDTQLKQAFEIVKVIKNNAEPLSKINADDNKEVVRILFKIVNIVSERLGRGLK